MVGDTTQLTNGSSFSIRPSAGNAWVIHDIYIEDTKQCTVKFTDGTDAVTIATVYGSMLGYHFHVSNDYYITITNNSGGTINVGYDGVSMT